MEIFINKEKNFRFSNTILLIMVFLLVFIGPILPVHVQKSFNSSGYTIIFLAAVLSLNKYRREMFVLAIGAILTEWVTDYVNSELFSALSDLINFIFFIIVVVSFIAQLVRSEKIGMREIFESINGYLLLGIIFSILIAVTDKNIPGALYFPDTPNTFGDYMYYGFITLSTLGYGDVVPKLPVAKSLAILTTVSGQFYMATIIAIIVSKFTVGKKTDLESK